MARSVRGAEILVIPLTQVQVRYLSRYASGLTIEEIADEAFVSKRTVNEVFRVTREVLGARNNVQAAMIAHSRGYLSDPDENGIVLAQSPFKEIT